jgi:hypothetical protein
MTQFVAIDSTVEVNGQTILSVVEGMKSKWIALDILKRYGIEDPKPDMWYSQQKWLDAFKEIAEKIGDLTLYMIGKKIPDKANWPPSVNDIPKALASIDIAYHMNHRKGGNPLFNPATGAISEGIGHYKYESLGPKKAKVTCDNPYPCSFDKGLIEAAANKFKPADAVVQITHDESVSCRKKGKSVCTYTVSW